MANEKTPLLHSGSEKTPSIPLEVSFKSSSTSKKDDKKVRLVSVKKLFRFSDRTDVLLSVLAFFGAAAYGFIQPAQFILFGNLMDDFVDFTRCARKINCTQQVDLEDRMTTVAVWYVGISASIFFFAWLGMGLLAFSAERQVHKMRLALFRNAIYQDIGWFDMYTAAEINSRLAEDTKKISDGIGSKLATMIACFVSFIAGNAIGLTYVWKVCLVLLATLPLMVLVGGAMSKVTGDQTAKVLQAYSKAGVVAEQSISSIRTVAAFGGEEKQASLYDMQLGDACKFGIKKGIGTGLGMGAFQVVIFGSYCLGFWYITKLVREGDAKPGDCLTAFFASTVGSMMLGQAAPGIEAMSSARAAAPVLFDLVDRKSEIDASSNSGLKPANVEGDVEFSHIDFVYPTRRTVPILNDFSLKVPCGTRVALVGESGCGKSTVVKLVQRFYNPLKGSVLLDGQDIKNLNVRHLRNFIGVVNQEPVLFATTIAENISYGREGVTQQEIEEAAKKANAHNFISQFPQGYETFCGERGAKMSGGQKQRIAIARALVRNPKILLLDEATSALDTESEAVVQEALDKAGEGRTTIIIAHRLSTVKNADLIVALEKGRVAEMGKHNELMAKDGLYASLVRLQEGDDDSNDDEGDDNILDQKLAIASLASTATTLLTGKSEPGDDDYDGKFKVSFWSILKMNSTEWKYLLIGCLGAALYGAYPFMYSIAFGGFNDALSNDPDIPEQREDMKDKSLKWSLFLLLVAVESGIGILLQNYYFAKAGEILTMKLRKKAFLAFLRQNIAYYDKSNHGTGAICTRLASEVSSIQGATGSQLGLLVAAIVTVVGGIVVAFLACWQLTLLMLAFVPILGFAGMFVNAFFSGTGSGDSSIAFTEAGQTAEETLSNIQTVVSLGREETFFERYRTTLGKSFKKAKRGSHFAGLAQGCAMAVVNLSFAAGFRYGGYLVVKGDVDLQDMMKSVFTVIMCAMILGQVASMTPDYSEAKKAANRTFFLMQKIPEIDSFSEAGIRPEKCNGELQVSNVRFRYPTRRNCKVLRNFSFTVKPGQTVALVGTSGCGKSTSVSLVERFYDVNTGKVTIDGQNVKDLNVKWLRSQIGIVSQEPVLFDLSIRDNIAYGDVTRFIHDKEIEEAARSANIHEFISSLPQGYDTLVGDKGTLISGGQKQRIAIARALIRDPKILLLDEATSALDTESEKVVQQALDKASIGRTTLVIAHRLSTIQHADQIIVIKKGRVVEQGTHNELMALKGIYHTLQKAQSMAH